MFSMLLYRRSGGRIGLVEGKSATTLMRYRLGVLVHDIIFKADKICPSFRIERGAGKRTVKGGTECSLKEHDVKEPKHCQDEAGKEDHGCA